MSYAGSASIIGMVGSMASSYLATSARNKAIKAQNKANQEAWEASAQVLRDQLSIAYNRTQIGVAEANRDRLANKMAVRTAQASATGQARVSAAQLGVSGRRGQGLLTQSVDRQAATAVSDIDINTQTEMMNVVNAFNDSASAAVAGLNANAPSTMGITSTLSTVISTIGAGASYWDGMSANQKADVSSNFNFKTTGSVNPASANLLDGAADYGNFA